VKSFSPDDLSLRLAFIYL
jgi:hypothetical protein